jgi:dipeptidyl aminopeptidase/acylaminoacyl peptidase
MPNQKRSITAEDLYSFRLIKSAQISPDGKFVAYSLQRVDRKTEKKFYNIWIAPTNDNNPHQFTYGDKADTNPQWSPDSKHLAFLSNRKDEKQSQLYIIPIDGGEARSVTDLKGSFGRIEWSPICDKILFTFQKKDAEEIERDENKDKEKLGVVSRHYDRVFFKYDGVGYLRHERWQLWILDIKSGQVTQLTSHPVFDVRDPSWSPDGNSIIFASNHNTEPDLMPDYEDLFLINPDGSNERKIETPMGEKSNPRFSHDGKLIAYFGKEGEGDWWKNNRLFIISRDGSKPAYDLTGQFDINVNGATLDDLTIFNGSTPCFSKDDKKIYFLAGINGKTILMSITIDDEPILEEVINPDGVVDKFSIDKENAKIAFQFCQQYDPGQLWVKDIKTGKQTVLTAVNKTLLAEINLGQVEEVWINSADNNKLQGWILKPPGFDVNKKYPAILEIHGGPHLQYGVMLMHEFQYLAAHGYIVFYCNPRGSKGYGEEHTRAIHNGWGTKDYEDIMVWTDYFEKLPYVDKNRIGVTGGSYGGYMTNWIIGHTTRFKAAVTQRSVSNLISMWGSSDVNWIFEYEFGGKPPYDDPDTFWQQSPIRYIKNAKTPTLVIHNENDHRCAIEQGEQVFIALKKLGVDTEFVRFPDEFHGLSRTGRTDRRIVRLNYILRWFDKYLKK